MIGIWELTESVTGLSAFFSAKELDDPAFLKYTHEKRKIEWLATRLLIRQLAGDDCTISYLESGKPLLRHNKYKHISISHSREFAAVILHEELNVGIDIEDTSRDFQRVEKKYLSDDELVYIKGNHRLQCLYWCAKEAIFKLVDDDGIDFRKQIHIAANPQNQNQFSAKFISPEKERSFEIQYDFFDKNCMVWAASTL